MLKIIGMAEDLVQETVDEIVSGSGLVFSGISVVVPSQRMIFFIRDRLNSRMNGSYFPPDLATIDHLVFRLFEINHPGYRIANEMESVLAVFKAIKHVHRDPVYPEGKKGQQFPDFFPWALAILKAVEELLVEGKYTDHISREIFQEFASLGEYHRGYKDFIEKMPLLVERFRDQLLDSGQYSRGIAYRKVAMLATKGTLQVPDREKTIFSGLSALNACEEQILKFFIGQGACRFLVRCDAAALEKPETPFSLIAGMLKTLNLETDSAPRNIPEWNRFADRVKLYCLPNQESQMVQALEILKGIVIDKENLDDLKKVAVVMPDPTSLIPFIHGVVSRFPMHRQQIPFNISLGFPFRRTPLYQLLISMMEVAKSCNERGVIYSPDYLSLIRHPYVKLSANPENEEEPLKRGIHLIEDLISRENLMVFTPENIENRIDRILEQSPEYPAELRGQIREEVKNLHKTFLCTDRHSLSELAEFMKQAVLALERNKKYYLFIEDYVNAAVNTLNQMIEFSRLYHPDIEQADFNAIVTLISHYFTGVQIYFQGSPLKGIQVMGMLESRGLSFDEVIVVDALEGVLPKSLKYDPLLPYDIRNAFGISNYSQWEILFAHHFFSLLGASAKTHILWIDNQGGGEKPEKSRFIERIGYEVEKQGLEAPVVIRKNCVCNLEPGTLKTVKKNDAIQARLKNMKFSASALESYIHCPLRFYFAYVAGLEERRELSPDPDSGELGSLVHRVLERFYRIDSFAVELSQMESNLKMLITDEFQKRGFSTGSGIGKIRHWVMYEKLKDFLASDFHRLQQNGIEIVGLEKKIEVETNLGISDSPTMFRGRIDRIEQDGDLMRLIDYKTGNPFRPKIREKGIGFRLDQLKKLDEAEWFSRLRELRLVYDSFQLLVYALLLNAQSDDYSRIDAAYIFLKPAEDFFRPVFIRTTAKDPISVQEKNMLMKNFRNNLAEIVADIFQRETFMADPRDSRYCGTCPFRVPCGNV